MYYLLFWKGQKIKRVNDYISDYRSALRSGELQYILRIEEDFSFISYDQENWDIIKQEAKKPLDLVFEHINKRFPNHKLSTKRPLRVEGLYELYLLKANDCRAGTIIVLQDTANDNITIFQQRGFFDKDRNELREWTFSLD